MCKFSFKCYKFFLIIIFLLILSGCKFFAKKQEVIDMERFKQVTARDFKNISDVANLFPQNVEDVKERVRLAKKMVNDEIEKFLSIPEQEMTFENIPKALDDLEAKFSVIANSIEVLQMVSPSEKIRQACHDAAKNMRDFAIDAFLSLDLYEAFKSYVDENSKNEIFNNEKKYFLHEKMKSYKRMGFDLPESEFEQVKKLNKEIAKLSLEFETNINTDKSTIEVNLKDLDGLQKHFIDNLKKSDNGKYILGCDYPTYFEVMENCKVNDTRKKLSFTFLNKAYPQNIDLLNIIIQKRDQLAKKLSFGSYADLDLDSQMVKTPQRAKQFLKELSDKTIKKMNKEFILLTKELPEGIKLTEDGKMLAWDFAYVKNCYKKKHFNIDEREISEYFSVENTIPKIFEIYQKFLGLEFKFIKTKDFWHENILAVQIYNEKNKDLLGFLLLDLYPRDNKYSHACMAPIVSTVKDEKKNIPAVIVVIANFPKANKDRPALLKHNDVLAFFHEFGHTMHGLLGKTQMDYFSGVNVKKDFVEMPSQMFEEWMWDKEILKFVGRHYKTGKSLPDELIDKKIELKKFDSGFFVTRQCWLSCLSLDYFASGEIKDTNKIKKDLHEKYLNQIKFEPEFHFQASFGHLIGYGAKYYGYMWAKVFALDLFNEIKKHGLIDTKIGQKLEEDVLDKGGSVEPDILLRNFLGREPMQDAFLKDLGIVED